MPACDERSGNTNVIRDLPSSESRKDLRCATAAEVRAMLTDLSLRPLNQREFLCKLLKRAARYASRKDFVVLPAETHHTSTS